MADESSAHRDEPEHVPGCAGTAAATAWCSNARPWHRDISPAAYLCRPRGQTIQQASRRVAANGRTAHRAGASCGARPSIQTGTAGGRSRVRKEKR